MEFFLLCITLLNLLSGTIATLNYCRFVAIADLCPSNTCFLICLFCQNVFIKNEGKLPDCYPITEIVAADIVILKSSTKEDVRAEKVVIIVGRL